LRARVLCAAGCCAADTPIAFDFLINDELLVTSLEAFIVQRGISAVRARRAWRRRAARPPRRLLRPKACAFPHACLPRAPAPRAARRKAC
jgi:hypothetical protein